MLLQTNNLALPKLPNPPSFEAIRVVCTDFVGLNYPGITNDMKAFFEKVFEIMTPLLLEYFPYLCEIARRQNIDQWKELQTYGNKGKYTESYGWSNDMSMKFSFTVPQDLRAFMTVLVYKKFWYPENERISNAFMNAICRGDDPIETLMKVKSMYGSNKDISLLT